MHRSLVVPALIAAIAVAAAAPVAHGKELSVSIEDLRTPAFVAHSLKARLSGAGFRELALEIDRLTVGGQDWRNVRLACAKLQADGVRIACAEGVLDVGGKIPISFFYTTDRHHLTAEARPAADEIWRMTGQLAGPKTVLQLNIRQGRLQRLASWLPQTGPKLSSGSASGTVDVHGSVIAARLGFDGVSFADPSGLRAGEKIGGSLEVDATQERDEWRWKARVEWRVGAVFWQPLFLMGMGQRLGLRGVTGATKTDLTEGVLELPGIGTTTFSARWNHRQSVLELLEARAGRVRVAPLYDHILKPLLQQTALADLRADGEAAVALRVNGNTVSSVDLELKGVSFEDRVQRRFALFGLNGRVPWRQNEASAGEISFEGAEFLKLPVGSTRVSLRTRGTGVAVGSVRIPILDGALQLRDFAAGTTDEGWRWRFSGELEPISMARLSQAVQLPIMHGSLSGVIPEMRYRRQMLAMDGALVISVFDGEMRASNVQLIEPFGRAPRLHADIEMKQLDLELLTRTFDFGTITGRIDARVKGLELVDWQPVRFDARIASSAGTYPKRISQRAVQNLSTLGGAGAAAAIQRSFLRFFEQFGYERIGLRCLLNNGVCEMDGIEGAPQGYVIVKGGGIPAISVIGYNRFVSWRELVDRLKRITQENVKAVVK